jgi:hypothetical protein
VLSRKAWRHLAEVHHRQEGQARIDRVGAGLHLPDAGRGEELVIVIEVVDRSLSVPCDGH